MRYEATMRNRMHHWRNTFPLLLCVLLILLAVPALARPARRAELPSGPAMSLHHIHTLLDGGLVTVLEGADMVMLADMKMAPGVDEVTARHGAEMAAQGKALIREVLSGSPMKELHRQGHWDDPLMGYTHELG